MTEEEGAEQSPDPSSDKKAFGKDVGKLVSGTGHHLAMHLPRKITLYL